jgi:hypothetical protein
MHDGYPPSVPDILRMPDCFGIEPKYTAGRKNQTAGIVQG